MTFSSPNTCSATFTTDVVVVGAGPAGLFQLFQLGLQGLSCHAIEALPHAGGQCAELYPDKPIYDIPAQSHVTGSQLSAQLQQQLAPFAIHWHWGHTVLRIDDDAHSGGFQIHTDQGHRIACKAIVLAVGVGAFVPRQPKLEHLDSLLAGKRHAFLQSHDRQADVAGQQVVVFGGDEAAVCKAIELAQLPADQAPSQLTLLHRRDVFKADEQALEQLAALRAQQRIQVQTGQIQALNLAAPDDATPDAESAASLQSLQLLTTDGHRTALPADVLLVYQGIAPKLSAMLEWQLQLQAKHIQVDAITQATSRPGIYAIGDIASYPGKRKLIATAFHESITAAYAIAERLHDMPLLTLYTTTHNVLLERLGQAPMHKA